MKLLFKQRFFSWLDSYDIYNECGETIYTVEGRLSLGHRLDILDAAGTPVGQVQEEIFTLLPRFQLFVGGQYAGQLKKEFAFFKHVYELDCNGWQITGDFLAWQYEITDSNGRTVAWITKELMHLTDTYVLDVADPSDALAVLMIALAADAAMCSSS